MGNPFQFGNESLPPIVAIHMLHIVEGSAGKVVAITGTSTCSGSLDASSERARLWTFPVAGAAGPGTFEGVPLCRTYLLCAGHSALADGRILTVGMVADNNPVGVKDANLFYPTPDIFASHWNVGVPPLYEEAPPPEMTYARWYPTATTLPDGKVLVSFGTDEDDDLVRIPEIYDPGSGPQGSWAELASAEWPGDDDEPLYPYVFVLPNGHLVSAGPGESRILKSPYSNPPSSWTWAGVIPDPSWPIPQPLRPGEDGSCVMYEPGKIMRCGGNDGVATTWTIDLSGANPDGPRPWLVAGDMNLAREDHNLVILPDGKVIALGGFGTGGLIYKPEIFDPASGTWLLQDAQAAHQHMYHSTALLLPDGRVVSAGGDGIVFAQIFKPPYITAGVRRPVIQSAPTVMEYGQPYTITYNYEEGSGTTPSQACLIRLASVTHGFDQDQRRVPLTITQSTSSTLSVTAPASGNIAPPGYYMLFILYEYASNQFAPCKMAAYVRVE